MEFPEIRFIIYMVGSFCRCFSEADLETNLRFALKQGLRIVAVERFV